MGVLELIYIVLSLLVFVVFFFKTVNLHAIFLFFTSIGVIFLLTKPGFEWRGFVVVALVVLIGLICLIRLIFIDIFRVFRKMRKRKVLKILLYSVLLSLPVFSLGGLSINFKKVYEQIVWEGCGSSKGLYQYSNSIFFARTSTSGKNYWLSRAGVEVGSPEKTALLYNFICGKEILLSKNTHEQNLLDTVDKHTESLRANLQKSINKKVNEITSTQEKSSQVILEKLFNRDSGLIPYELPEGLQPPSCNGWLWSPAQCLTRRLLTPVNSAYEYRVKEFKHEVEMQLGSQQASGEELASQVKRQANKFINEKIDMYQEDVKNGVKKGFYLNKLIDFLGLFIIFTMMVKTYFYVLSRLVFANDVGGQKLYLSSIEKKPKEPIFAKDITGVNHEFSVPLNGEAWFGSFNNNIKARKNSKTGLRRMNEAFFARFLTNKLALQKFIPEKHECVSGFTNNNFRFYKINIKEGQEVCFHFSNLVAFSSGIHFKRRLKPKLSAFLQYQLIFSTAVGVGDLIIKAEGGSGEIMNSAKEDLTADPLDVLAFDMNGCFTSFAETDLISTYTQSTTILPCENTLAIRHSPSRASHSAWLRIRKILFFFLPF